MHAEGARIIPAGMFFFSTVLVCTGFGKIENSTGFYGTGTENHGKSDISTGTVGMRSRERYLHGNGKKSISREILREISRGNFPEEDPVKNSLRYVTNNVEKHERDSYHTTRTTTKC